MDNLIEKLERADGPNYDLMLLAFKECNPVSMCWDFDEGQAYEQKKSRFVELLLVEAWEQAALTLVPDGWDEYWQMNCNGYHEATFNNHTIKRTAFGHSDASQAIAICIAALKARGVRYA